MDGAIHSGASYSLRDECEKLGGCNTGDSKITTGMYKLIMVILKSLSVCIMYIESIQVILKSPSVCI